MTIVVKAFKPIEPGFLFKVEGLQPTVAQHGDQLGLLIGSKDDVQCWILFSPEEAEPLSSQIIGAWGKAVSARYGLPPPEA